MIASPCVRDSLVISEHVRFLVDLYKPYVVELSTAWKEHILNDPAPPSNGRAWKT